ncbi:acyl-CoA reductase [Cytophagales bacterium LB-30]|uniref:Acyl-CoA reductase n=1 Tax=Shiella aurantiaca TaxID=3058365 RepID=A0ABT8F1E7_9BACT|nr:acyl-CoA reductase [Shiella aurantiaca]MDN4164260.1 acyl-CoA reductase [Shiella aurantiaca]
MKLTERIQAFSQLHARLSAWPTDEKQAIFAQAKAKNPWFTEESCERAVSGILAFLEKEALQTWVSAYPITDAPSGKRVGLVLAGNIPLVGFHDLLCVLISGHKAHVKLSSQDEVLPRFLIHELIRIDSYFAQAIELTERLNQMDAVIATGSDNTARYFDYYFREIPHIVRKNRTSMAVINGQEKPEDNERLGRDIFQYYGLGCRNVSKIFIPKEYYLPTLIDSLEPYHEVINHNKYVNNYEYRRSIFLVNKYPHLDNGFLLFEESTQLVSPIGVLYYERYEDEQSLKALLDANADKIQCVVSNQAWWPNSFDFGQAQTPNLSDYADNVDTLTFLTTLAHG